MSPALIGLDWGTSSLRAYLLGADGGVQQQRVQAWGVRQLPAGGFAAALTQMIAGWPALPLLAAGMVGSREGWCEVPYVDAPAGVAELAAARVRVPVREARGLHIVPGVRDPAPDVMRGEETQVIGAVPQLPARARVVLPGTHSKWVGLTDGRITDITTMMTGELFALLRQHSILAAGLPADATSEPEAFERGVCAARDSGAAGVSTRLFRCRALMLEGRLAAGAVTDYLSGLLIGEEWRCARATGWLDPAVPLALVGDPLLVRRYLRAAMLFGIAAPHVVEDAAARGLWRIARRGGLVSAANADKEAC